jgi:glycosyltransferase involved in cell wall biosynthesis
MAVFEKLRIGFDAKRAFTNSSGLGSYSRSITTSLRDYYPQNDYILFTPRRHADGIKFDDSGFKVVTPANPVMKIMGTFWRNFLLTESLKSNGIDLFHGLSNELTSGIHKLSIPTVVTIHDLVFMKFPGFYQPADRYIYQRKVIYACQTATKIIAVSKQTKKDLINLLNVPEEKISVVYQPISGRYFDAPDNNKIGYVKDKYNLSDKFILSVGTIEERKNQLSILEAVVKKKIDREVVLVGRMTGYAKVLIDYIRLNKLENKVRFLTNIPDDDLPAVYQLAGVMVYPSRYEGFGIPVIEAMASGCPVLTSTAPCLPETAGDAAMFCNPSEINSLGTCIKTITENQKISTRLVARGKERALAFTPEQTAKNLVSIYKSVLANGK